MRMNLMRPAPTGVYPGHHLVRTLLAPELAGYRLCLHHRDLGPGAGRSSGEAMTAAASGSSATEEASEMQLQEVTSAADEARRGEAQTLANGTLVV